MYKMVNGERVRLSRAEISDRKLEEAAWASGAHEREVKQIQIKRSKSYPPIGDQLDALYKYLMTVTGENAPLPGSEISNMLTAWKKVKQDNPYPTKE